MPDDKTRQRAPGPSSLSRAISSKLINPDVTLAQIVEAGERLRELGVDPSVPTLIGDWYVYHTSPLEREDIVTVDHLAVLQKSGIIDAAASLGSIVAASEFANPFDKVSATLVGPWYVYKSNVADVLDHVAGGGVISR